MDIKMKKLLKRIIKDTNADKQDSLQSKVKLQQRIVSATENGEMAVHLRIYWMVDHVTSSRTATIPATIVHFQRLIDGLDDEACLRGVELIKPSQADYSKQPSIDHLAEAYENGHPHVVYI